MEDSAKPQAKQTIEGVVVRGGIRQRSDTESTEQSIKWAKADDVRQQVSGQRQILQLGKYSASGKWAVVALVLVVAMYFIYQYAVP